MKLRFNILIVLLFTACIATFMAALSPDSFAGGLIACLIPGILLPCSPLLIRDRAYRGTFARGAGIGALAYLIGSILMQFFSPAPHTLLAKWIAGYDVWNPMQFQVHAFRRENVFFMNFILASSVLGGMMALLRKRNHERHHPA
jgi:hypothetical protein